MTTDYHVIGNYISPYVRKVLVCMELKGLDYTIDPIAPFVGDDRFTALSPLRRIPVLVHGQRVINDSTVICQYLDELHPQVPMYPSDVGDRAQARWLEEYADSWLGDVVIWGMFYQMGVKRFLFGEAPDEAVIARARDEQLPATLDHLEKLLPAEGFLFGEVSMADISIAAFFRNAAFVRYKVDAERWPRVAGFVERTLALPAFRKLAVFEDKTLRTPLPKQREVLLELGAPVCADAGQRNGAPQPGAARLRRSRVPIRSSCRSVSLPHQGARVDPSLLGCSSPLVDPSLLGCSPLLVDPSLLGCSSPPGRSELARMLSARLLSDLDQEHPSKLGST